ncbi:type I DNA topoisomerase [Endothiovibrio diazotrophicus]
MGRKLMIVESPTKAREIAAWLGAEWTVRASLGHIADLPERAMGVEPPNYRPQYVFTERGRKTVANLLPLAKAAEVIYIATDPDREGESIAYHVVAALGLDERYQRVTFNAINERAVKTALARPRRIDLALVRAADARRVLDRLVGYRVSPALGRAAGTRGLSAGRVQSPALRLVVEREEAIERFRPTDHFGVTLSFESDGMPWSARWDSTPLLQDGETYWLDRPFAERVAALRALRIIGIERREARRKPPPPFTTSTLLQAAANALGLGAEEGMRLAQALFEGGGPHGGLITYHRTDQPNLSDEGVEAARAWLLTHGQGALLPDTPHTWKAPAGAQEAHEAIRPLDFAVERIEPGQLNHVKRAADREAAAALYRLIWERAVACQMTAAVDEVTTVELESLQPIEEHTPRFVARGRVERVAGWRSLTRDHALEDEADEATPPLPRLEEGAEPTAHSGTVTEHRTQPPPRYTEAALNRKLEELGIGRPSTYASIMTTLHRREYVSAGKKRGKGAAPLTPTERGRAVVTMLREAFRFMDYRFTAEMEARLDRIAQGQGDYARMAAEIDDDLEASIPRIRPVVLDKDATRAEIVKQTCPECGQPLALRNGKKGKFLGCTAYPDCRHTEPWLSDEERKHPCPADGCDGYLRKRTGAKGAFWGCSRYPACKETRPDEHGRPGLFRNKATSP